MKRSISIVASFTLSAVVVFFSHGASAEEPYQAVISGIYSREDGDQNSRTITYGLQGRFYFAPVITDGHPYGEAAFLERIGSVYVLAEEDEFRNRGRNGDGPVFRAGINAIRPGVPYTVEAYYVRSTRDYDPPSTQDVTGDQYVARAGYFVAAAWQVGLSYLYSAWDNTWAAYPEVIVRQQQYGLFTKYDHDLGQDRLVSLQATLGRHTTSQPADPGRNTEASILIDYYFTRSLSIGAGFRDSSGTEEAWEGTTYSANVQYFLTPRFSVRAGVERFLNANDGRENSKSYNTVVSARF